MPGRGQTGLSQIPDMPARLPNYFAQRSVCRGGTCASISKTMSLGNASLAELLGGVAYVHICDRDKPAAKPASHTCGVDPAIRPRAETARRRPLPPKDGRIPGRAKNTIDSTGRGAR